jgi:hypothetical protein
LLYFPKEIEQEIIYLCEAAAPDEVQGFGKIEIAENKMFVTGVYVPHQVVGGAHTDTKEGAVFDIMADLHKAGKVLKDYPLWWHSHVNMGTSPSNQDHETLFIFAAEIGWAVGTVFNLRGDRHSWMATSIPIPVEFTIENKVVKPDDARMKEAAKATILERVSKKVYNPITPALHPNNYKSQYKSWWEKDKSGYRGSGDFVWGLPVWDGDRKVFLQPGMKGYSDIALPLIPKNGKKKSSYTKSNEKEKDKVAPEAEIDMEDLENFALQFGL